jgi:integrase
MDFSPRSEMPRKRKPEPFWRAERNCYFVQIGKKQIRLDPDEQTAWRLYHELMAKPPEEQVARNVPPSEMQAAEVLDLFLGWCRKNRAEATYEWSRHFCQKLTGTLPADLLLDDLKPYHVTRVMDAHDGWSNNTKRDFVTAIQRALNWAVDEGLIERSPIARMKKPAGEAREDTVSAAEFDDVMAAAKHPTLRDLIELAWECGARVQELRKIEARFVDLPTSRIVFPPSEAKGKKHFRVIYLGSERAKEIVARLCEANPKGPILLNSEGRPWNKDSINCAFCRIEKKIGRKLHLGAMRKGFTTEALKAGVDTLTVAHLLGHRDGTMISKIYGKVQQDPTHMLDAARKAKANPGEKKEG